MKTTESLDIQTTADGSLTLYRSDIDEHYHSVKGALAESLHVYIETGWKHAARLSDSLRVFEVGFGTGLNAALTEKAANELKIKTDYHTVELFPLSDDLIKSLTPLQSESYIAYFKDVNEAPWNREVKLTPYFRLYKRVENFLTMELPADIDVIYFDAFAPEKQPEMWSNEIFRKLYKAMSPGGILTTYCAKGTVRRLLQGVGFTVERLPGPPGGKREILRATKPPI